MFKTEINKSDIEDAISEAVGEKVLIIGFNPEDERHIKGLKIVRLNKETGRYTDIISELKSTTTENIYKTLILNLITIGFPKDKRQINGERDKTNTKSTI